ncbi:MAG: haloacid dehalogenase type II [Halospina sp.]
MALTLAFDVYGTLVDPSGMVVHLRQDAADAADAVSRLWREKQVEYAFRRGLMRCYEDFGTCTRQALQTAFRVHGLSLDSDREDALIQSFLELPAFPDAQEGLRAVAGYRRFAFSNGTYPALEKVLGHNGLREHLEGLVSVDDIRSFKPDPAVYAYARRATGAFEAPLCLVSSNSWDVIGARSAGLMAIWVKREPGMVFEDWGFEPNAVIGDLTELPGVLG